MVSKNVSRRRLLGGAALVGGGAATSLFAAQSPARALGPARGPAGEPGGCAPAFSGSTVTPDDQRYADLVRSWNGRFVGHPDYVQVVGSAAQVERALAAALHAKKRIAVRSGGHCLEDFVANSSVQAQIDMSPLSEISYDPARKAIAVGPGGTLRDVYKTLFTNWSVTVPGGICPAVGVGGHFCGGGFGPLARRSGVVPDHIDAVEVVTVDRSGTPHTVVATSDRADPNRDLWWAHTGGGGGNFGVVTKYWMRTHGVSADDPSGLLPKPPRRIHHVRFSWQWSDLDQRAFTALLKTYLTWHVDNSAPGSAASRLYAMLTCQHAKSGPTVYIDVQIDPTEPDAARLLEDFRAQAVRPVPAPVTVAEDDFAWLESTNAFGYADTGTVVGLRNKGKGSYIRRCYTDEQLATTYKYLTQTEVKSPLAGVLFFPYGGQVNAIRPDATAVPQRDSVVKALHTIHWSGAELDSMHLTWLRTFYRDVHAATGGVPGLDGVTDGSYINYADTDLADPAWNTSGTPWYRLYYKDNFDRLQAAKARWDPLNVFRHKLSIPLPD